MIAMSQTVAIAKGRTVSGGIDSYDISWNRTAEPTR